MKKAIQVLDSVILPKIGIVIHCTCDEIQQFESKSEIENWFANYNKVVIDNDGNQEYSIVTIDPMISLTDIKLVGIQLKTDKMLSERYPINAYVT